MSEEKQPSPPSQAEPAPRMETAPGEDGSLQRRSSRSQQKRRQRSVFQYIAVLFAAAFVLLLFTFLMERRQNQLLQQENQEQIDTLQQSATAVQSLQNLYDENAALKETVAELEDRLEEAERQLDVLPDMISNQEHTLEMTIRAMDHFWQIDEAYVKGRYSLCRSLIEAMEDTGSGDPLAEYLPRESATDNGRFSPYDRYQEIRENLY